MSSTQQSSKEYFKTLGIIHLSLIGGLLLFGMVSVFLQTDSPSSDNNSSSIDVFMIFAPVIAFLGITASYLISNNRLQSIKKHDSLSKKMNEYRSTQIVKYALLEGPALFSLVSYLLTGNCIYLILAAVLIVLLFMNRPTKFKAISDLTLNKDERDLIDNPEAMIAEL